MDASRPTSDPTEMIRTSYDSAAAAYVEHLYGELTAKPLDRNLLNRFAEEIGDRGTGGEAFTEAVVVAALVSAGLAVAAAIVTAGVLRGVGFRSAPAEEGAA